MFRCEFAFVVVCVFVCLLCLLFAMRLRVCLCCVVCFGLLCMCFAFRCYGVVAACLLQSVLLWVFVRHGSVVFFVVCLLCVVICLILFVCCSLFC